MATTISTQDIIDAKRDIDDIGKAVNENTIVSPRYGEDFKSLPMIAAEAQATIGEWQNAINTIVIDDGVPALAVSDASGETQQTINLKGSPIWYARPSGYSVGDTVRLENGDNVKSTIPNNTTNPNTDMTGWEFDGLSKSIYNPMNLNYTQQQLATAFTASLNALIQKVSLSGGGTISIPDGSYSVDPSVGITLRDNIELRLGHGTHIKNIAHNLANYEILRIHDVRNVRITGGKIDGNKSQNSATSGEWGMGVSIRGATDIHVDTEVVDCWGDGIYIGRTDSKAFSENVNIPNLKTSGNRRQGVSVVSVKGLTGEVWELENISGTNPQDGVDFEPNNPDEFLMGISIGTIISKNVTGSGVEFNLNQFNASAAGVQRVDVSIRNIIVDGSGASGLVCYSMPTANVKGIIKVGKLTTSNVSGQAFIVNNWNGDSVGVYVDEIFTTPIGDKTQISLVRKTVGYDTGGSIGGVSVGHITVNYPTETPNPTVYPINIHSSTAENVLVKNVKLGSVSVNRSVDPIRVSPNILENVSMPKLSKVYSTNLELSASTGDISNFYEYVSQQTEVTPYPFFTVATISRGHKYKVRAGSSNGARLRFRAAITVEGFNNNGQDAVYILPFGSSVEFESIDANTVRITAINGFVTDPFTTSSLTIASDIAIAANSFAIVSVPFFNKVSGRGYAVTLSAPVAGMICTIENPSATNAVTVKLSNLTASPITCPAGRVVTVSLV